MRKLNDYVMCLIISGKTPLYVCVERERDREERERATHDC